MVEGFVICFCERRSRAAAAAGAMRNVLPVPDERPRSRLAAPYASEAKEDSSLGFGQNVRPLVVFSKREATDTAPSQAADKLFGFVERDR
jgi:hypothetical protein